MGTSSVVADLVMRTDTSWSPTSVNTAQLYSDSEDSDSNNGCTEPIQLLSTSVTEILTCDVSNDNSKDFSKGAHRFPVIEADNQDELVPLFSECSCDASTSSSIDSGSSRIFGPNGTGPRLYTDTAWPKAPPRVHIVEPEFTLREKGLHTNDPTLAMRRWSTLSVTSTGTIVPSMDAANCGCTSLAWSAFRPTDNARRKKRREGRSGDDAYRKASTTNTGHTSTDSGIGSSSSSEDSQSAASTLMGKPPLIRKRRRSLGVLFGSVMRLVFDSSPARKDRTPTTPSQADIGNLSPKWRGDDTNEAEPLSKLAQTDHSFKTPPNVGSPILFKKPESKPDLSPLNAASPFSSPCAFGSSSSSNSDVDRSLDFSFNRSPGAPSSKPPAKPTLSKSSSSTGSHTSEPAKPSYAGRFSNAPRFHFPGGQPVPQPQNDQVREQVRKFFNAQTDAQLEYGDMDKLCQLIDFPCYSKRAVYEACLRLSGQNVDSQTEGPLVFTQFQTYWQLMTLENHDDASRFVFTLAAAATGEQKPRNYLLKEDFFPMLMDLIHTYPGLSFLVNSTQFHLRYCEVVVVRIFWTVNRSWTGRLTPFELRRSNFLSTLRMLETVTDINKVTDYFSYEHFYVAYCKFWELDQDHDMIISRDDMRHHNGGAIPDVVIDRIFSGAVIRSRPSGRPRGCAPQPPMETIGFEDFVAFLLAEEDKKNPTSQEYWFRILDLDGDGVLSLYEMEYFYREIERKLVEHNFDTLAFRDVACNLFDSIAPRVSNCVTLKELKKCGLAHRFFNTFVNYLKYLEQESSEGERASVKTSGDKEMSDWDQFCAMEYEMLMSENENDGESYADENIEVVLGDDDVDEETRK